MFLLSTYVTQVVGSLQSALGNLSFPLKTKAIFAISVIILIAANVTIIKTITILSCHYVFCYKNLR